MAADLEAPAAGRRGRRARGAGRPSPSAARTRRWVLLGLAAVALVALASLALGARDVPPATVLRALTDPSASSDDIGVVRGLRLPRTVVGLLAGAGLGVAGALMQGLTRNALADPGLLGINAGASLAVVAAITLLGATSPAVWVWCAFAGAAAAALLVHAVAGAGRGGASPVTLALTGAAVSATLISLVDLVLVRDVRAFTSYRFWVAGSLTGRGLGTASVVAPFIAVGLVLAVAVAGRIDLLALGEDVARGLGSSPGRVRAAAAVAVVLLAGSATALAGPVVFVGLVAPHAARAVVGVGTRAVVLVSALVGPVLLVGADVVGRFVAPPGELEAGIVVAALGAPLVVLLVRRGRLEEL